MREKKKEEKEKKSIREGSQGETRVNEAGKETKKRKRETSRREM